MHHDKHLCKSLRAPGAVNMQEAWRVQGVCLIPKNGISSMRITGLLNMHQKRSAHVLGPPVRLNAHSDFMRNCLPQACVKCVLNVCCVPVVCA